MSDSIWKREAGLIVPLGVAAIGQFLVLLERESAYFSVWGSLALHALPATLLWLGGWAKPLERLGLILLAILTGWALSIGTAKDHMGLIGASAAIPVLLATLLPAAGWVGWVRLFSWPSLGFVIAGLGCLTGETKPFPSSDSAMLIGCGLVWASWNYIDSRKDWSFRKQRRLIHFALVPLALLLSFGSWSDKVTHGIRVGYVGYLFLPVAVIGFFGFDPFGPEPPKSDGESDT